MKNSDELKQPLQSGTWGTVSHVVRRVTFESGDAADDVANAVKLERGCVPLDAYVLTDGNAGAGITASLGLFQAGDASDQEDATHFMGEKALDAAARYRADSVNAPEVLDDDYYVGAQISGDPAGDTVLTIVVFYRYEG